MGTTLTGTTPANTYDSLIKVTDNGPLSGTAKYLSDGLGNDSALALSTSNVGIGTTSPSAKLHLYGAYPELRLDGNNDASGSGFLSFYRPTGGRDAYIQSNSNGLFIDAVSNTIFSNGGSERMRITSTGNVGIGTTSENARLNVVQPSATRITSLVGNNNAQGSAQNYRVVRHYPVGSLGTKLIIPFVSQGNLNSNTIVRIFGHSARYNSGGAQGFTADFTVGHLSAITALTTLSSTGNIASIASSGSNVEITFTSNYTSVVGDGLFVTIEYMTNVVTYSIDVTNIAMN